jgi:hypothetical protein
MSRVQKVGLHPTEDRWRKTEGRKNNALQIRLCVKKADKGLFALISVTGNDQKEDRITVLVGITF